MESRRELNDAERAKLNELIVANKALLAPLDEDITNLIEEDCKFKVTFKVLQHWLLFLFSYNESPSRIILVSPTQHCWML